MAHKHAQAMALYAQDALESDTPWENWETYGLAGGWVAMNGHPRWLKVCKYRRKPNQAQVDIEAFNDWYDNLKNVPTRAEAWLAALEWERSKK